MVIDISQAFEVLPPPIDFIWPGFIAGTVGALVAPGATGKSYWALQAAMSVACHVPDGDLFKVPTSPGACIISPVKTPYLCCSTVFTLLDGI